MSDMLCWYPYHSGIRCPHSSSISLFSAASFVTTLIIIFTPYWRWCDRFLYPFVRLLAELQHHWPRSRRRRHCASLLPLPPVYGCVPLKNFFFYRMQYRRSLARARSPATFATAIGSHWLFSFRACSNDVASNDQMMICVIITWWITYSYEHKICAHRSYSFTRSLQCNAQGASKKKYGVK